MKTSELQGAALDWAVAKCEGQPVSMSKTGFLIFADPLIQCGPKGSVYSPSTDWTQGGPIIAREEITLTPCHSAWEATKQGFLGYGPTLLIAAMRCYVASKPGDEVEVPKELT